MSDSVPWLDWSTSAFEQAATRNVPIFLSLVTCWSEECRVMDRTAFANPDVVAFVSSQFVPVRVDGDRRPDINERYTLGGWPTTAFLTPEREVLSGATYLAADQLLGLARRVADAWRDRAADIRERSLLKRAARKENAGVAHGAADLASVDRLRALLVTEFDRRNGGFGTAPKVPHAAALHLLLSLLTTEDRADAADLAVIIETTLDKMWALWDRERGGFRRFAESADWTDPASEKTLEDNAALLHVYIEAAARRGTEDLADRVAQIAGWVRTNLTDAVDGTFYNALSEHHVDRSMYVDRNAAMAAAFLRAGVVLNDRRVRDFGLKSLEEVILSAYVPGSGVAHTSDGAVRGLLADQVAVASAAIWGHVITEQLPFPMLAAELMQFALRTMWDESARALRDRIAIDDPVHPFQLNCEAACVLDRLATITGDPMFRDRSLAILGSLAAEYPRHGLFGASYALAVREIVERQRPVGLELGKVEW